MKRSFAWFLSLLILCISLAYPMISIAASSPTVSLEQIDAEAGEIIEMQLTLSGNPGMIAMLASVRFDPFVLQLTDVKNGTVFPDEYAEFGDDLTVQEYTMTWLNALANENYTADGLLAVLTFRVLTTAKAGNSTVSVSLDQASIFDCNLEFKFVQTQNGSVNVSVPRIPVTDVSLSQTELTMRVGDSVTLTASVLPPAASDKSVQWSSSASSVAAVSSNGQVTAKAVGSAGITVTTNDGGKTKACSVTVLPALVSVSGVSVSPHSLSMTVGETSSLTIVITPGSATDKTVQWSSSVPSVASVDNSGKVTAKAAGSTIITVTTNDGGKTAVCAVSVKAATVGVTGVSLPSSLTINYKDSARLTASVTPSDATNPAVQWSSSNTKVVEVDGNGNLKTHRKGSAVITATTADGGKQASCTVNVQYTFMQKIIIYVFFGWIWYVK